MHYSINDKFVQNKNVENFVVINNQRVPKPNTNSKIVEGFQMPLLPPIPPPNPLQQPVTLSQLLTSEGQTKQLITNLESKIKTLDELTKKQLNNLQETLNESTKKQLNNLQETLKNTYVNNEKLNSLSDLITQMTRTSIESVNNNVIGLENKHGDLQNQIRKINDTLDKIRLLLTELNSVPQITGPLIEGTINPTNFYESSNPPILYESPTPLINDLLLPNFTLAEILSFEIPAYDSNNGSKDMYIKKINSLIQQLNVYQQNADPENLTKINQKLNELFQRISSTA